MLRHCMTSSRSCGLPLLALAALMLPLPAAAQSMSSFELYTNLFRGNITVSGTVVDTNRQSMANVRLAVAIAGSGAHPMDGEITLKEYQINLANGQFTAAYSNCHSMALEFTKDNYIPVSRIYSIAGEDLITNGSPRTLDVTNQQVVLFSKTAIPDLIFFDAFISTTPTGAMFVMDVAQGRAAGRLVAGTNALSDTSFYLTAPTNSAGIYEGNAVGLPTNVLFHSQCPQGLFPYTPPPVDPNELVIYSPFRDMRLAPLTGYTNALPIRQGRNYFYFNVSNYYGKGYIGTPNINSPVNIDCRAIVYFATNGSRNVTTEQ